MTEVIKQNVLPMCEYTTPVNLISKASAPMLKVNEPDELVWNFFSMSELFTGPGLPFESCPEKFKIIRKSRKNTNN